VFEESIKTFFAFPVDMNKRQRCGHYAGHDHYQKVESQDRRGHGGQNSSHPREHDETRRGDMKISLVQHPLELQCGLNVDEETIHPRDFTHQLTAREYYVDVIRMCRVKQRVGEALLQTRAFGVGAMRRQQIRPEHEK
jgi:hypothetical protein